MPTGEGTTRGLRSVRNANYKKTAGERKKGSSGAWVRMRKGEMSKGVMEGRGPWEEIRVKRLNHRNKACKTGEIGKDRQKPVLENWWY